MCLRALGITSGTSATTFSPGRDVTRAQFATMLSRLYNLANPRTQAEPEPEPEQPEASEPEEPEEAEAVEVAEEPTVEPEPEVGVLLPAPSRPMPPGGGSGPPANGAAGSVLIPRAS